ncbi:hypothetical protein RhiirB3_465427 [Rhizophagus irregularis]|nr:hypothetical protein RhiirB3_465427 [Rhizophagus irregularis]
MVHIKNIKIVNGRDGNGTDSFHENCDNKGPTIWVAKIKDSTQLIGGYNPLDWNGNTWKTTADSFLFNFTNGKSISTAELGYVNNTRYAVYCDDVYGPTMGNLQCNNNNWSYYGVGGCYHPKLGIPTGFTVEEYEVFQDEISLFALFASEGGFVGVILNTFPISRLECGSGTS